MSCCPTCGQKVAALKADVATDAAVREDLTGRLWRHVLRDLELVRRGMHLLGGNTIHDFDNRRLALLLAYLDQPVLPRDSR